MTVRRVLLGAAWLSAVSLAAAGVVVVSSLAQGLGGGDTAITAGQAERELAEVAGAATDGPATASPTSSPAPGRVPGTATGTPTAGPTGGGSGGRPGGRPGDRPPDDGTPDRPATAAPSATSAPATRPPAGTRPPAATPAVVRARGGTVTASCAGGEPTLLSWTPAQGYAVDEVEREDAKVRFDGPGGRSEVRIRCAGDQVRPEIRQ